MFYTYVLLLSNSTYYSGYSSNLKQRLNEHNRGFVTTTKKFIPAQLVFYAAFLSKKRALEFERYLKTNSGFAFRNKHFI